MSIMKNRQKKNIYNGQEIRKVRKLKGKAQKEKSYRRMKERKELLGKTERKIDTEIRALTKRG